MFSLVLKSYLALTTFSLSLRILTVESAGFTKEGFRGDPRHYDVSSHNSKVVCYWGTWSNYRPNAGKFTPENINPKLCTHIIYSFAGLEGSSSSEAPWSIKSLDPWMDLEDEYRLAGFRKVTDLKYVNPKLKITLAIGGWNEGSTKYSEMARDPEKRKTFVESVVEFLKKHNFDGLDLDWEYPAKRGGIPEDKDNFILLIRDLRAAFEPHGYLLTAAIGAAVPTIDTSYDVPSMYKYLDLVHVMCYDYHGKWDKKTGHNAPLYSRAQDTGKDVYLNVEHTVNHLMKKGAIPEKTVLGVPFYGRAFKLENPHDSRMGARSRSTSFAGPYTREDGFLGYNEICEELTLEDTPWKVVWDEDIMAPYMHNGLKWVSFDNEKSIRKKSEFAFSRGLGGVMVWSIDTDDFTGRACGGPDFPLLRTINNALYKSEAGLVPGLTTPGQQGAESLSSKSTTPSFLLILLSMTTTVAIILQKSIF